MKIFAQTSGSFQWNVFNFSYAEKNPLVIRTVWCLVMSDNPFPPYLSFSLSLSHTHTSTPMHTLALIHHFLSSGTYWKKVISPIMQISLLLSGRHCRSYSRQMWCQFNHTAEDTSHVSSPGLNAGWAPLEVQCGQQMCWRQVDKSATCLLEILNRQHALCVCVCVCASATFIGRPGDPGRWFQIILILFQTRPAKQTLFTLLFSFLSEQMYFIYFIFYSIFLKVFKF